MTALNRFGGILKPIARIAPLMAYLATLVVALIEPNKCIGANASEQQPAVANFSKQPAHGLAFGDSGDLYISKERRIWRVSPDGKTSLLAELPGSVEEKPRVWSLAWHNGALYGAAHDRIIRISADGKVTNLVEEAFSGLCGVTDLVFDKEGNLFVAYDNIIACYTPELKKRLVLDGSKTSPVMRWITSLRIDQKGRFWLSDVASKRVVLAELGEDGLLVIRQIFDLSECPEYFAVANDGRVYVGFPDAGSIACLRDDNSQKMIPLAGHLRAPVSMAFGGPGFDSDALYIAGEHGVNIVRFAAPVHAH